VSTETEEPTRTTDGDDGSGGGGGYVHRPGDREFVHPESVDREFDWRGWVVVVVVAVSFLVVPVVIVYRPPSLPYWTALLALPMLPALLLGAAAVWGTTRP
jgi:hypothetical protein